MKKIGLIIIVGMLAACSNKDNVIPAKVLTPHILLADTSKHKPCTGCSDPQNTGSGDLSTDTVKKKK